MTVTVSFALLVEITNDALTWKNVWAISLTCFLTWNETCGDAVSFGSLISTLISTLILTLISRHVTSYVICVATWIVFSSWPQGCENAGAVVETCSRASIRPLGCGKHVGSCSHDPWDRHAGRTSRKQPFSNDRRG